MGHLINPIAFRLGWTRSWVDSYYINYLYYPELLHAVLKLRYFYNTFLNIKRTRKHFPYLYDRLWITKTYTGFHIHIYYYDAYGEISWDRFTRALTIENLPKQFWRNFFSIKRRATSNYKFQKLNFEQNLNFFLFIFFFKVFTTEKKDYVNYINANYSYFRPMALQYHFDTVFSEFAKLENLSFLNRRSIHELSGTDFGGSNLLMNSPAEPEFLINSIDQQGIQDIFIYIFGAIISRITKNMFRSPLRKLLAPRAKWNKEPIDISHINHGIFTFIYQERIVDRRLRILSKTLNFFGTLLVRYNCNVSFFQFTGDSISAAFLAKYICTKLSQNYRFFDVLNPILRELKILRKFTLRLHAKVKKNRKFFSLSKFDAKKNFKIFSSFFNKLRFQFYLKLNSLINFDIFSYLFYFFHKVKSKDKFHRYIGITTSYLFFFKKSIFLLYKKATLTWFSNSLLLLDYNYDMFILVRFFFFELNADYSSVLYKEQNYLNLDVSFITYLQSILKITVSNLLDYLNFFNTQFVSNNKLRTIGARVKRIRDTKTKRGLLGFKIQCKGRFTRRQIAAKHVFVHGSVPLSTLSANIDYGFATKPILNSSIGVKVWFHFYESDATSLRRIP